MGWLSNLIGGDVTKPIDAIGNAVDKIFTSDEERLTKAESMERLKQALPELTAQLDQLNAKSSIPFVVMARPFNVWVAGLNVVSLNISVVWFEKAVPEWYADMSLWAFGAALGIYSFSRTAEKIAGKAK